jgi:cell volume regulation protein A
VELNAEHLDQALLIGSLVMLVAIGAVRLSARAGLPSLLLYLLIGVAIGDSFNLIDFENEQAAHALGLAALIVILTEGGLTTSWPDIRPAMRTGLALATIGVAVSVLLMSLFAHYLLGFDWELAVLIGAVTAPTDAAAVFSVLRRVPLPRRLTGPLEAESGLNDAPAVLIVTLVSTGEALDHGVLGFAGTVVVQLAIGVAVGLLGGFGGAWVLRRAALPASGLYPLTVLSLCVLAYGVATVARGSGFAAVYLAALVLGNSELPHRSATRSFAEGMAWLSQIGLFVMLGLLLSPKDVTTSEIGIALAAGAFLGLVVRPLSVLASSAVRWLPWPDQAFLSWAGLRGAVPIVLATIPRAEEVPGADQLFDIVFVLVVLDTVVTGPTLPWVARQLRVTVPGEARDLEVEAAPLERIAADLLQIHVTRRSRMHGVEVAELRLPVGASVALVVRGGETMVPDGRTVIRRGDDLLVVTPRRLREATEDRLRAVSRRGRLAHWLP